MIELLTKSPAQTMAIAACVARNVPAGTIISLDSEIGVGKTVWCKGFINAWSGIHVNEVTSPAFSLVNEYAGVAGTSVFHIDFYRLDEMSAADHAMFDEYLSNPQAVSLLEWGGKFVRQFTENFVAITIEFAAARGRDERKIRMEAFGTCELSTSLVECFARC